jgi:hypothetical protein
MNVLNVPMRLILRLPFATPLSNQLMLVYLTGRKSVRKYVQPVSFVPDNGGLLTPGGGRWKLNLREDSCVRARLHGRPTLLRPEIISEAAEVDRLLRIMAKRNGSCQSGP